MPSLFSRHKHSRSSDSTAVANQGPGAPLSSPKRKGSLVEQGYNNDATPTNGLIGNLKHKLHHDSKGSLFHNDSFGSSDSAMAGGGAPGLKSKTPSLMSKILGSGNRETSDRRMSMTSTHDLSSSIEPSPLGSPWGHVATTPAMSTQPSENAIRRNDLTVTSAEASPTRPSKAASGREKTLDTSWQPIQPDVVGVPTSVAPVSRESGNAAAAAAVSTHSVNLSSTTPPQDTSNVINSTTTVSPTKMDATAVNSLSTSPSQPKSLNRAAPGQLVIPPPNFASRKSSSMAGMGINIVPSTPLPRPIANLPTLNGVQGETLPSAQGERLYNHGQRGSSSNNVASSPVGNMPGSKSADARLAKKAMVSGTAIRIAKRCMLTSAAFFP